MKFVAVILLGWFAGSAAIAAGSGCSVTFYGDSILHGMAGGLERLPESPARHLKTLRPAYVIEDLTAPGASAIVFSPALETVVAQGNIVVVQYGINDILRGTPDQYATALTRIVQRQRALGKAVIVTGLSQSRYARRAAYDDVARRTAKRTGAVFADWGSVPYDDSATVDGTHAGQAYSQRLTDRLATTLDGMRPDCRL